MSRRFLLTSILILIAVAAGLWLAWPTPITQVDQEQPRLNQAAPIPRGPSVLTQTIIAGHDGFSAIELLAVVYPDNPPSAVLTVEVSDQSGKAIAKREFKALTHNAPIQINFAPQAHSAGQMYQLRLSGTSDNNATVWSYNLDGYLPGALTFDGHQQGDLRFSTTYTYLWQNLVTDALSAAVRLLALGVPLALVLWLPGALLLDVLGAGRAWLRLAGARLAIAVALSVTLLSLAWLWAGVLGWRWSAANLGGVYITIGALAIARLLAGLREPRRQWHRPRPDTVALAAILLTVVVLRLLVVRDLAFPAWVDSSHHVLVARLLEATGHLPANYEPALPISVFYYHFAFHALAVSLHWMTGLSLVDTVLFIGQILNGLVPMSAFSLAWGLTGWRRAALAAAFVVGLVSFFPGYFVTWGRYTQLTGLLVLGPAAAVLWRASQPSGPSGGNSWIVTNSRSIILAALLATGVFLSHYRVLYFFAVFALVALLARLRLRQAWLALASTALLALVLSLPWVARLINQAVLPALSAPGGLRATESYNAFPADYFSGPLEEGWLILALVSGLWGLWRRDRAVWTLLAWTAAVFASLNTGTATWLVNNNSWAISLFMPGSVLLGWGVDRGWHLARVWQASQPSRPLTWTAGLASVLMATIAGLGAFAGLTGARTQLTVINPATILATAADRDALVWIDGNLPPRAVIAVNGWNWLGSLWAGSDGGAWILPVTGRQTTLPPNDYAYASRLDVIAINDLNAQLAQVSDPNTPEFRALLARAGVTHIFIGARGGPFKPEKFVGSQYYRLLFSNGADWVFAVAGR